MRRPILTPYFSHLMWNIMPTCTAIICPERTTLIKVESKRPLKTIEDFLGDVPIHHYAILDMDGVVEIVDYLGGVEYNVGYPVRADFGSGALLLDQGLQRLNAQQFLTSVRDRSI